MQLDKKVEELLEVPLLIAAVKDKTLLDKLDNLIPYSTGFEIEGHKSPLFNSDNFEAIPYILDISCSDYEQRFRIPNGIRGIVCLYLISRQLRINCELNPGSGIHYHVDCTDSDFSELGRIAVANSPYIMKELDTWGYISTYNTRGIGGGHYWIRLSHHTTFEFRIGEMTFDYPLLLKRIMHANSLTKYVKDKLDTCKPPVFESCDFKLIAQHLKLPYSLKAYNKNTIEGQLLEIQKQKQKLDEKVQDEQIFFRNRKHTI